MKEITISVHGMSCGHCEKAVKNALLDMDGVSAVTVDLKGKTVTVEYDESKVSLEAVKNGIIETGYRVINE